MTFNAQTARIVRPELALAGALALMSLITGRKIQDKTGLRANLYVIGLADSGAGKTHAKKLNGQILAAAGHSELSLGKPKSSSALVSCLARNPLGLLQIDELADWLNAMRSPMANPHLYDILSVMKELYSECDNDQWKPSTYADTSKNVTIGYPHLSFYGVAPPEKFWGSLTRDNMTDGLVGRLIVIGCKGDNCSEDREVTPIPDLIRDKVRACIEYAPTGAGNLNALSPKIQTIRYTEEAYKRYRSHTKQIEQGRPGESKESHVVWGRSPEKTGKLSMLSACSRTIPVDGNLPTIEIKDVEWSIKLNNWCTREMLRNASEHLADNHRHKASNDLLKKIPYDGTPKSKLIRSSQNLTSRERDDILNDLMNSGRVVIEPQPTGGRPGQIIKRID